MLRVVECSEIRDGVHVFVRGKRTRLLKQPDPWRTQIDPEWVPDPDERSSMYQRRPIRVYNARLLEPPPSVDRNGFTTA